MSTTPITETPVVSETTPIESKTNRMVGQVKWFNNKVGFGFITIKDEENVEKDIFAHYSTIRTAIESQYRYLVQGEYVEFDLSSSKDNTHEYQSANISGINGGKLMCETRQANRPAPVKREGVSESRPTPTMSRPTTNSIRSDKRRPVAAPKEEVDNDGFQVVRKRKF